MFLIHVPQVMLATAANEAYSERCRSAEGSGPSKEVRTWVPSSGVVPDEGVEAVLATCTVDGAEALVSELGGRGTATLVLGDLGGLGRLLTSGTSSSTSSSSRKNDGSTAMDIELYGAYRRQLLWSSLVAVDTLAPGGCLVLRMGHMLTSFSSTLFYLLHRCGCRLSALWALGKITDVQSFRGLADLMPQRAPECLFPCAGADAFQRPGWVGPLLAAPHLARGVYDGVSSKGRQISALIATSCIILPSIQSSTVTI